jgi:hypothetical protein
MADTKRRSTTKTSKTRARRTPSTTESLAKSAQSYASSAERSISKNPKTSAAVAAGVITGIAAGVAGYLAFKRSGKTFEQFSGDIATSVKDSAASASTRIKDGIADLKTKSQDFVERQKDGFHEPTQSEIAEEALTLKETGKKSHRPVDDTIETELKTGAISY